MKRLNTFSKVLQLLGDSIQLHNSYKEKDIFEIDKGVVLGLRDSMIQRFKYSTDLFWKVLKVYLEEVEKVSLPTYSPRSIIRKSVGIKLITEDEGKACLEMIKSRNQTSHIYHEQIAVNIAHKIPKYFDLLKVIVERLEKKNKK